MLTSRHEPEARCANLRCERNRLALGKRRRIAKGDEMRCRLCGSEDVTVQVLTETDVRLVTKHHGILWWLAIGWWWVPIKWVLFTIPALIAWVFRPARQRLVTTHRRVTMAVCQRCGHTWRVR